MPCHRTGYNGHNIHASNPDTWWTTYNIAREKKTNDRKKSNKILVMKRKKTNITPKKLLSNYDFVAREQYKVFSSLKYVSCV